MTQWHTVQGQRGCHIIMGCILWGWITPARPRSLITEWHRKPSTYLMQTNQLRPSCVWAYTKDSGTYVWKWCGGRGQYTIGITSGSIWKNTPGKRAMVRVPVEAVFVLPKKWTRSLTHLPSPYLDAMIQYRELTHQKIILLIHTWIFAIEKYWCKRRREKHWHYSPHTEIGSGKVIPMGDLKAAPEFTETAMKLKMEWDTLAKECGLKNITLKQLFMIWYCIHAHRSISYHTL